MKLTTQEYQSILGALRDAAFMFKEIERARELPPTASVIKQYIATGHEIIQLLKQLEIKGVTPND